MNSTLQVLTTLVTLTFLGVIVRMVRARQMRAKYSFLWMLVGAVFLVFSIVPGLLDKTARAAGILYAPALLFLGATLLLLFIAVHFSWELSRIEERSRTLTEELALAIARIEQLERGGVTHASSSHEVAARDADPKLRAPLRR
ncbi:MAG: hypothetical protein JWN72_638 [Thermoleophilia bacterium]|nr:hypothetical protein [Thermoleophilia bacterium]